jgi:hypothetical protein
VDCGRCYQHTCLLFPLKKKLQNLRRSSGGIDQGDLSMPEEINRMVTDSITDHFLLHQRLRMKFGEKWYSWNPLRRQYHDRYTNGTNDFKKPEEKYLKDWKVGIISWWL